MAMRGMLYAAACVALLWPVAGLAGGAGPPPKVLPSLPAVSPEAEAISAAGASEVSTGDPDEDAVLSAVADQEKHGLEAIGDHEAALRKVLADMPMPFMREQVDGDRITYRGDSMADCLAFATTLKPGPHGKPAAFVCKGNPYAVAGFYLGSYLNEVKRYDEALAVLNIGLVASSNSPALVTERNASFFALHRWDEALSATDRELALPNLAADDRARLLRNRGFVLTALQRLDEARQAYEDSLQLAPGNALALNELRYIAQLKNGGAEAPSTIFRPNAPRKPAAGQ